LISNNPYSKLREPSSDLQQSLMTTPVLETPRLKLHPLQLSDAVEVQPLFAQWEIVKQLNVRVPWPFPDDGVETYYRNDALLAIERGDEWHWMLHLKDDPEAKVIGSVALVLHGDNNRGFWIAQQWQGRGLMTEAATAVTRFWFEELKQPVLRIKKAGDNAASRALSCVRGCAVSVRPKMTTSLAASPPNIGN
jgi:[ribosomal protein S5]-alanine N-acetyltransferase